MALPSDQQQLADTILDAVSGMITASEERMTAKIAESEERMKTYVGTTVLNVVEASEERVMDHVSIKTEELKKEIRQHDQLFGQTFRHINERDKERHPLPPLG